MKNGWTANPVLALAAGAAVVWLAGCGRGTPVSEVLTLYVPCGMELPFVAAQESFERAHPGVTVNLVLDNGNVLVRRVLDKGERPDLLVSPGMVEMDELVAAGRVAAGSIRPFGRFDLVLFVPRRNPGGVMHLGDLIRPEVTVVAIADPEKNSVGRYTKQALESAGLWEALRPKMTFADHPITAYQHVAREKAQASFAYRSCPLKTAPDKLEYSAVRIVEAVPLDSYDPAFACIAPLTASTRAAQFVEFLRSTEGQELLGEHDIPILPRVGVFVPVDLAETFEAVRQAFAARYPGTLIDVTCDRPDALLDRVLRLGERPDLCLAVEASELRQLSDYGEPAVATALPPGPGGGRTLYASIRVTSPFAPEAGSVVRFLGEDEARVALSAVARPASGTVAR